MIVVSTTGGPASCPRRTAGEWLVASIDVEWTKNYRVKNGNRPFCCSIVWVEVPDDEAPADLAKCSFAYTSVYTEHDGEAPYLVESAAVGLAAAIRGADLLVGHQLCTDLGVLAAHASSPDVANVIKMTRDYWRRRREHAEPWIVDTRYDATALLTGRSRRLVDVCTDVGLDVTQPELARTSMTALHRHWLESGDAEARERITVMNLRHSLSTALVALRAVGWGTWTPVLNVNDLLDAELAGTFAWIGHPTFRVLTT